ncbi:hypothetical protein WAI453_007456 [Rhynchosporium graminicola]
MITNDNGSEPFSSATRLGTFEDTAPSSVAAFCMCHFGLTILLPSWKNCDWTQIGLQTLSGKSLLELGALSGEPKICQFLIEHGADINERTMSKYGSALAALPENEDPRHYISSGSGISHDVAKWRSDIYQLLIRAGADVNTQLENGKYGSALAAAAKIGDIAGVESLHQAGAKANIQIRFGEYGSVLAAAITTSKDPVKKIKLLIVN